jgi:hypothetical protein
MRLAIAALALALAACNPAAEKDQDADAGSTGVADVASAPFTLESEALVGTWSFDRSCASGDGMTLNADGAAGFDEWGTGTWATADNNRVVLTLARSEPGLGPTGETVVYNIDVAAPVTDDLIGNLARPDGSEPRGLNARRCPETP